MDAGLVLTLALMGVVGFSLGLFGGGGSILSVPVLVYVARVAPAAAVGMSLAIVGATSLAAGYVHHRRGHVRPRVALAFVGAGVPAAFLGARLTHLVSGNVLMLSFAVLMGVVGISMFANGRDPESTADGEASTRSFRTPSALIAGAGVGAVTGFLGVGGGFLVVPALIAFTGLDMRKAIGTSLLVIAINSAAGLVGHLDGDGLDLKLAATFTAIAVAGAVIGERTARASSLVNLRRWFGVLVVGVGATVAVVQVWMFVGSR